MRSVFNRLSMGLATAVIVLAQVVMPVQAAFATGDVQAQADKPVYRTPKKVTPGQSGKSHYALTICHATASFTNPYEQITIDLDAANSNKGKADNPNDHTGHTGGLFDGVNTGWGDIIPSYSAVEDVPAYSGLNWGVDGQTIYDNDCTVPGRVATPTVTLTGVCGLNNDTVVVSTSADYTASAATWDESEVSVTFTIKDGVNKVFAENSTKTITITENELNTQTECGEVPGRVATPTVTLTGVCGLNNDTVVVSTSADYTASAATWDESEVSVTFTIKDGVNKVFAENSTKTITITENELNTQTECGEVSTKCTVPQNQAVLPVKTGPTSSYSFEKDGMHINTPANKDHVYVEFDAGNTPLKDIDQMSYKTLRLATSGGAYHLVPAYYINYDIDGDLTTVDDQGYLVYEPLYSFQVGEAQDIQTGVWQTWDVLKNGETQWWGTGLDSWTMSWNDILAKYPHATAYLIGINQGSGNPDLYTVVQDVKFDDCFTMHFDEPGRGGDTPDQPPVVTDTPVVPGKGSVVAPAVTELPETGAGSSALLIGLLAAAAAYGAVYFAQSKRQYE